MVIFILLKSKNIFIKFGELKIIHYFRNVEYRYIHQKVC